MAAFSLAEVEVMIFGIVFNVLLQRAGSIERAVLSKRGVGNKMKTQGFAHEVGGHFPARQRAIGEIP